MAQTESDSRGQTMDRLKSEARGLLGALGDRALSSVRDRVGDTAGRLTQYVEGGAGPGLMAAFTGARNLAEGKSPLRAMFGAGVTGVKEKVSGIFGRGGRKGGGGRKLKLINIVETLDVGVPVRVAYNQWTQYSDFPKYTKKVENVDSNKNEENKTNWKAQVFWSHRTWEATVIEQVPDERIIWRSKGQKGHVDGSVTFHELAPNLTRILLVMEYHPQGLFERTGNLWRAQGRRARLEFKHFRRHMMMEGILHADELEGWRGTIHDGEVVESHEDAMAREQKEGEQEEGAGREESRQASDGQIEDEARSDDEKDEARSDDEAGEPRRRRARETAGERGGGGEAESEDEESGDGRPAAARRRRAASSGRGRSAEARSAGNADGGNADGGNGRRRRTGATTRRGGSR
ncbi:MAG: SRPBCC family protein [Actinobacteria bacterium]|nr:SRPBCC family protein [Actinomycetota bacterium]